jgi:hypothetical protein
MVRGVPDMALQLQEEFKIISLHHLLSSLMIHQERHHKSVCIVVICALLHTISQPPYPTQPEGEPRESFLVYDHWYTILQVT